MLQKKKTQKSVYPQEVVKRAIELGAAAVILVLTVPSGAVELFRVFFFKQKTAYEVVRSDWSSDVCSSDLSASVRVARPRRGARRGSARPCSACADRLGTPRAQPGRCRRPQGAAVWVSCKKRRATWRKRKLARADLAGDGAGTLVAMRVRLAVETVAAR